MALQALTDDSVAVLREAANIPLLTAEEERELAANKTERNIQRLMEANIRLIRHTAKFVPRAKDLDSDSILAYGTMGLRTAAEKYDGTFRFSTYASWWIRSALTHNMDKHLRHSYNEITETALGAEERPDIEFVAHEDHIGGKIDNLIIDDIREKVIESLGFDHWRCYYLKEGYGWSKADIAKELRMTVRTVGRRLADTEMFLQIQRKKGEI